MKTTPMKDVSHSSPEKIAVIGCGVAGAAYAILKKAISPKTEITIFESTRKPMNRVLVSGNGRANFFNRNLFSANNLKDPLFNNASKILKDDIGKKAFDNFIEITRIPYRSQDDLIYPYSNKSVSLHSAMSDALKRSKVDIINRKAIDIQPQSYDSIIISTVDMEGIKKDYRFSKCVLAMGGSSYDYKEFDWSVLKDLNVKHIDFKPALCPLKVKEDLKRLDGVRAKCEMILTRENKEIYTEQGEVLFKKDGLSGICIFNASIRIDANHVDSYAIHLNLLKQENQVLTKLDKNNIGYAFYPELSEYIQEKSTLNGISLYDTASDISFEIKELYPFKSSQVSKGGIVLDEIDTKTMSLKKHSNISVLGEMLDVPLPCGGYNIGMCIVEAWMAANAN